MATVILTVNTDQISQQSIDPNCSFGQGSGITNENFTITPVTGETVTWQGVSSNAPATDTVNITSINYEGGNNVFDQNTLAGNGAAPECVVGTIQNTTPTAPESYTIFFTVFNNGVRRNGTFRIDPKIQVNT